VGDRIRTQFLSAVVLVVVFAAGGLVGAALTRPGPATDDGPVAMVESSDEERTDDEDDRRYQTMYERAGATEQQAERIRSEVVPWFMDAREELWNDSTVQALDSREDSLRSEYRSARRDLRAYYEPRERALTDSARVLIRAVLDPQAQLVYDSLVAERNRRVRDDDDQGRHP